MIADRRSEVTGRGTGRALARVLSAAALLATAFALAGCSTSIADLPVGTAAESPAPHEPGSYLPVHDLPPDREEAIIPPAERAKIQSELLKARDHQATAAAAPGTPAPTPPAPATKPSPPKQSRQAKPPPGESRAED